MNTETVLSLLALLLLFPFFTYVFIIVPLQFLFSFGYRHYYHPPSKGDVAFLKENVPYFNQLDHKLKKRFIRRVYVFARGRRFISKSSLIQIDRSQKLLISAAIAQLTFGLKVLSLPRFRTIEIHPKFYHFNATGKKQTDHLLTKASAIHLSWEDFLKGDRTDSEGVNLGLQELTLALSMENKIKNGAYGFLKFDHLMKWRIQADVEMKAMKHGHADFFPEYAATNQEKFFAVAVEYFFDKPREFSTARPLLYASMKELLFQDPLIPEWPILAT
ncbi:MAG TPA: hypothetical protein DDX92_09035 [Flavobacteriales bacterium]|jgi:Mlc titration factor MtfA (ptsG expression regulator)|nr:hypothetical protein [Flavobacteriales bacterium]